MNPKVWWNFCLGSYQILHSLRNTCTSKLILCVQKDLKNVNHTAPVGSTSEFVSVTVKNGATTHRVIAAYLDTRSVLDARLLDDILKASVLAFILTGNFNAHHLISGSSHITARAGALRNLLKFMAWVFLMMGAQRMCAPWSTVVVYALLLFQDHCLHKHIGSLKVAPAAVMTSLRRYISLRTFKRKLRRRSANAINCPAFQVLIESSSGVGGTLQSFEKVVAVGTREATITCSPASHRDCVDVKYQRLRALRRRRTEIRPQKTQNQRDWCTARRLQNYVQHQSNNNGNQR